MSDPSPVVVVDPSDPTKAGKHTSEFSLARLMAIVGSAVAIGIPVIAGLSGMLSTLSQAFPGANWLVTVAGALGGLATALIAVSKLIGSRTDVKVAQIEGAAAIQAAIHKATIDKAADIAVAHIEAGTSPT